MKRKYIFAFVIQLACVASAFASCGKPESLFESKDCLRIELQRADQAVNKAFRTAMNFFKQSDDINKNEALKALSDAQRAWLVHRKKDCGIYSVLHANDNNASQNEMACELEHAKLRVIRLKELIQ